MRSGSDGLITPGCGGGREGSRWQGAGSRLAPLLPATCYLPPCYLHGAMADSVERNKLETLADTKVADILQAAASWAREVPPALTPAIRAVCVRLAEMVADQRHYLAPLPEPQESERAAVLTLTAERLRAPVVTEGIASLLQELADIELRSTGARSRGSQAQWIATAIHFLEGKAAALPAGQRPDSYWADDVVAGIIASVRALVGVGGLPARTEARG